MTDSDKSTVAELAELIGDQNERIRNLTQELDEQNDIIVEYELDQENVDKLDAAIFSDLKAALEIATLKGTRTAIEEVLGTYFGDYE